MKCGYFRNLKSFDTANSYISCLWCLNNQQTPTSTNSCKVTFFDGEFDFEIIINRARFLIINNYVPYHQVYKRKEDFFVILLGIDVVISNKISFQISISIIDLVRMMMSKIYFLSFYLITNTFPL